MRQTARPLGWAGRAPVLFAAMALAACSEPQVLDPPPMLAQPAEYAFGDSVAAADGAAVRHVIDLLEPRFGRAEVRRYTASSRADFAELRAYYDMRAAKAGWRPIPDIAGAVSPRENAIGYRADGAAFAVVWLTPRPDSPLTPVNVIRFAR